MPGWQPPAAAEAERGTGWQAVAGGWQKPAGGRLGIATPGLAARACSGCCKLPPHHALAGRTHARMHNPPTCASNHRSQIPTHTPSHPPAHPTAAPPPAPSLAGQVRPAARAGSRRWRQMRGPGLRGSGWGVQVGQPDGQGGAVRTQTCRRAAGRGGRRLQRTRQGSHAQVWRQLARGLLQQASGGAPGGQCVHMPPHRPRQL